MLPQLSATGVALPEIQTSKSNFPTNVFQTCSYITLKDILEYLQEARNLFVMSDEVIISHRPVGVLPQ